MAVRFGKELEVKLFYPHRSIGHRRVGCGIRPYESDWWDFLGTFAEVLV